MKKLDILRLSIARKVRRLRKVRHWTQADLSKAIGLSQSRFSEIERGKGSFTAEQFLAILQTFNVAATHFAKELAQDQTMEIQNALARLGGAHLRESANVLPSEQLNEVSNAVRETLITGNPRLITALAPVLVSNIDRVNFRKLHATFVDAGLERRLAWLVENILEALIRERDRALSRTEKKIYRRAEVVLSNFVGFVRAHHGEEGANSEMQSLDILDERIRSNKTLKDVRTLSSDISKRWGIITSLHPNDFIAALRAAHDNK